MSGNVDLSALYGLSLCSGYGGLDLGASDGTQIEHKLNLSRLKARNRWERRL